MLARLRRFRQDRRGATAVEFAMVATPFFFMMFAAFEYALVYLVTVSLDSATAEAARKIRTGEVQQSGMTATDFKNLVCTDMGWLSTPCATNLYVDARVFSSFGSSAPPTPVSGSTFNSSQLQFNVGGPGDIVMVTSFYQWSLLTPGLSIGLANMGAGIDVVSARSAFRNEPYSGA